MRKQTLIFFSFIIVLLILAYVLGPSDVPQSSRAASTMEVHEDNRTEVLHITGENTMKLDRPMGVATDGKNIYVANAKKNQVVVFDQKGKGLFQIDGSEIKDGGLSYPVDLALNSEGDIYVADFANQQIQVFSKKGEFEFLFPKEKRIKPAAIALDQEGKVYVSDVLSQKIKIYTAKGKLIREFGGLGEGQGEFKFANGIDVEPDGKTIYVSDSQNKRIQVLDGNGKFIREIKLEDMGLPKGIFLYDKKLFVTDALLHKICVFDLNGQLLDTWGKKEGTYNFPNDVFLFNQKVYVADREGDQVLVFPLDQGGKLSN